MAEGKLTFEEAYEKAKALRADITDCTEYEDYYVFGSENDENSDGGDGPCVILKRSGEAINFLEMLRMPSELIGEIELNNID